jgi:hypothetical protein
VLPGPTNELGSHRGGIGLDLMVAFPAPYDQPEMSSGSVAERHRRAGISLDARSFSTITGRLTIPAPLSRRVVQHPFSSSSHFARWVFNLMR